MTAWYAVHTHARKEVIASQHLLRQGFDVYFPQHLKKHRHARRISWVRSPFFPRYLFAGFDLKHRRWGAICSTIGVSSLIKLGGFPIKVPPKIIEGLKAREDETGLIRLSNNVDHKPGDFIQIRSGVFEDMVGILQNLDDQGRISMLLDIMGCRVCIKTTLDNVVIPN